MKRRFATRKYATRKFKPRRFAGISEVIVDTIHHIHYFILTGMDSIQNFILQQGQSFRLTKGSLIQQFIQKIKDN